MEYRSLGRSGLQVSEVSLGSWLTLGSSVDRETTREIVHRAYDLGINFFDTADVYASGAGRGGARRGAARDSAPLRRDRHQGVLSDVAAPERSRALAQAPVRERRGLAAPPGHRLRRPAPVPPRGSLDADRGDGVRLPGPRSGRARSSTGACPSGAPAQIAEACRVAGERLAFRPISNQPQYSLLRRQIEAEVIPTCEREGLSQVVFSPLAQGVLSGKYSGGARPSGSRATDAQRNQFMRAYLEPETLARVDRLQPLADELGISLAQLALAWCLRKPQRRQRDRRRDARGAARGEREGLGRRAPCRAGRPHRRDRAGVTPRELPRLRADAVVVGSGAGGAPAAARLAEAGFEVLVLEAGPRFSAADFLPDEALMTARLGRATATASGAHNLYAGACVGGSTVVNDALCWRTPPEVLEHWRREHALRRPQRRRLRPVRRRGLDGRPRGADAALAPEPQRPPPRAGIAPARLGRRSDAAQREGLRAARALQLGLPDRRQAVDARQLSAARGARRRARAARHAGDPRARRGGRRRGGRGAAPGSRHPRAARGAAHRRAARAARRGRARDARPAAAQRPRRRTAPPAAASSCIRAPPSPRASPSRCTATSARRWPSP